MTPTLISPVEADNNPLSLGKQAMLLTIEVGLYPFGLYLNTTTQCHCRLRYIVLCIQKNELLQKWNFTCFILRIGRFIRYL